MGREDDARVDPDGLVGQRLGLEDVQPGGGDLARLQGCWSTTAGPRRDIGVALTVEGSEVKVRITLPRGGVLNAAGELRIDETTVPHALDWVHFRGLDGQDLPDIPAIYEFDGDTLRVCNGGPNNARPEEFKPGEGLLADVLTFRRTQPKSSD